jgi:two-component system alkaline phosphatase synthesis response regulator PhoP
MSETTSRILIVEDEPDMAMGLRDNLQFEGYEVLMAEDGESGLEIALAEKPSLVLLDIMLPKRNGFEVCSELRAKGFRAPVLMLTARGQEIDKVRGLELGADDYVTKPFGVRELLARIKAALRRYEEAARSGFSDATVQIGASTISFAKSTVRRGRKTFALGYYESEILRILLRSPGEVVERSTLLKDIWGLENEPTNRSVDNHIVSLRRKLEATPAQPRHIVTVHGFGYKFVP